MSTNSNANSNISNIANKFNKIHNLASELSLATISNYEKLQILNTIDDLLLNIINSNSVKDIFSFAQNRLIEYRNQRNKIVKKIKMEKNKLYDQLLYTLFFYNKNKNTQNKVLEIIKNLEDFNKSFFKQEEINEILRIKKMFFKTKLKNNGQISEIKKEIKFQ